MPSPSRPDLEDAARALFAKLEQESDRPRRFHPDHVDDEVAWNIECSTDRIRALDDQLRQNAFDGIVKVRAASFTGPAGLLPAKANERDRLFAEQLSARAEREHLSRFVKFLKSPHRPPATEDPLFETDKVTKMTDARPHSEYARIETLLNVREAVTDYIKRQSVRNLGKSQIEELSRALMWLREVVGDSTSLASVGTIALRRFRDDLARLDVSLRGRPASFKDRLTNVAEKQVKSVTARRYWRSIQAFFSWCVAEQLLPHDPAAGLRLDIKKGQTARTPPPFDEEELQRLFETPLYAGYRSPKRVTEPGHCSQRGGRWWSGVLLLFTGLRAGELSQLLPGDFSFDSEIPHLKIREEDDQGRRSKSTKNEASVRDVPIAPELLELGLRQFVEERAAVSTTGRVFREFRTGTKGRQSDGLTKFWASYLRKFKLWKPGRSTHVFRHTVVACLRANYATEEDIAAFVGHSTGTVTAKYGGAFPLGRKLRTSKRLNYGFEIIEAIGGAYDKKRHA